MFPPPAIFITWTEFTSVKLTIWMPFAVKLETEFLEFAASATRLKDFFFQNSVQRLQQTSSLIWNCRSTLNFEFCLCVCMCLCVRVWLQCDCFWRFSDQRKELDAWCPSPACLVFCCCFFKFLIDPCEGGHVWVSVDQGPQIKRNVQYSCVKDFSKARNEV